MKNKIHTMREITVGELIKQLKCFDKDQPISFGDHTTDSELCGLSFYRLKNRGVVFK